MEIKFYFDEDSLDLELVEASRLRGLNILTASEAENRGKSDEEQLEFAASIGRVIYTCNIGDFARLHTEFIIEGKDHSGILLAKQRGFSVGEQVRRMIALKLRKTAEEMQNQIEFLSSWNE